MFTWRFKCSNRQCMYINLQVMASDYSVFLSERPKYMKAQSFWYGSSAKILVWRATISFYIAHFLFYVVGHDHQTSIWQSTTRMFSSRLQSVISRLARHLVFWTSRFFFTGHNVSFNKWVTVLICISDRWFCNRERRFYSKLILF